MRATSIAAIVAAFLAGGAVQAAPIPVSTGAVLGVSIQGLAPITTRTSGVVEVTTELLLVPAGLVSLSSAVTIPITGVSAVNSLVITKLSNLSATFSVGGVTAQSPAEVCPTAGPAAGFACNAGGDIGGAMGLTGSVFVHVIPNIVVIPVNLNAARIGQGGVGAGAFTTDAALWSRGVGLVNTGNNVVTTSGATFPFTLVTPTFISALGNLLPVFGTFILTNTFFVPGGLPEPGTWLLLASGVAGLLALRRH